MKIIEFIKNLTIPKKNSKKDQNKESIPNNLRSNELVKKLALLVKSLETVNIKDLKFVDVKKYHQGSKEDLFTAYRLDFNGRNRLDLFKKKYKDLLL